MLSSGCALDRDPGHNGSHFDLHSLHVFHSDSLDTRVVWIDGLTAEIFSSSFFIKQLNPILNLLSILLYYFQVVDLVFVLRCEVDTGDAAGQVENQKVYESLDLDFFEDAPGVWKKGVDHFDSLIFVSNCV